MCIRDRYWRTDLFEQAGLDPNKPPKTEKSVQTDAMTKAFVLLASIIGIKIISGGIGKNELSIKEMNAKNQDAYFFDDCSNVQLYKNRKTFISFYFGAYAIYSF